MDDNPKSDHEMGKEDDIIDEIVDKYNWSKMAENNLPGREDILLVAKLMEVDPATVLMKMRGVVEKFVNFLYRQNEGGVHVQEGERSSLADKIKALNDDGQLPELINLHINTIRLAGNIGAHSSIAESERHVRVLIPAFVEVVRWFAEERLDQILGGVKKIPPETPQKTIPTVSVPNQVVVDNFETNGFASHWAPGNGTENIAIAGGVLCMNLGGGTDWWESTCGAPYLVIRGGASGDYASHEYVAEVKYVPNFADWDSKVHAGVLLMEDRPGVFPNEGNVMFWGAKNEVNDRHYALEGLRQAGPGESVKAAKWDRWTPTGTPLPKVARVRQVRDPAGWRYVFEAASNFGEPALVSYSAGPYPRPHLAGIFAKSWKVFFADFAVGFQAFRLEIY